MKKDWSNNNHFNKNNHQVMGLLSDTCSLIFF